MFGSTHNTHTPHMNTLQKKTLQQKSNCNRGERTRHVQTSGEITLEHQRSRKITKIRLFPYVFRSHLMSFCVYGFCSFIIVGVSYWPINDGMTKSRLIDCYRELCIGMICFRKLIDRFRCLFIVAFVFIRLVSAFRRFE